MNEDSFGSKTERFIIWLGIYIALFLWVGVLFAPLFLPTLRKNAELKYKKFTYKDILIKEEMNALTTLVWAICIIGWVLSIIYVLFVGL